MLIDPVALKQDLKGNVVEVVFTKLNGEVRRMRATLSPQYVPQEDHTEVVEKVLLNEENAPQAIAVWDIDANGWRSFRTDRIISCQGLNAI
jgi:WYL_2, Sm-like SH3 beta-barrel fold